MPKVKSYVSAYSVETFLYVNTNNLEDMSKTTLKKQLKELTREQLIEVMLELYDARKDAREYLEYYVNPDEKKMHEKYKAVITKEFFPQKGRAKGRTSVCKKAIKEFTTLHPSPRLIADLRLWLVEAICRYAVSSRGWIKESQEGTALTMFADTLNYLFANDILEEYRRRIDDLLALTQRLRGPLRTLKDAYAEFNDSMK